MEDAFFKFLGIVGAICFAFSGVPQAIKSAKEGHSNGMSGLTVWFWTLGEGCMLLYGLYFYIHDLILILNYLSNFFFVSIIFKYKYWPRKRLKT